MSELSNPVNSAAELACAAARAMDDKKGDGALVLFVGDLLQITDYFVICSANNRRLVKTLVDEVEAAIRRDFQRSPVRMEGVAEQQWVLIDYGDFVVHVFHEETRVYYEIERLYRDAPRVDWQGVIVPSDVE
jgi:ribosome-associated protein